MRNILTAAVVFGALFALPAMGLASAPPARTREAEGIVRSMDATRLRITRWPSGQPMSFVLNPSTARNGHLRTGATVDVRYRTEGDRRIATDVIVERSKLPASTSGAHQ